MMDLIYISAIAVFLILTRAFANGCEQLEQRQ